MQIVNDPSLRSKVRSLIENQRLTALSALQAVMNSYAAQFAQIKQENFRERMNDIRDVILTIESHLSLRNVVRPIRGDSRNGNGSGNGNGDESVILVAHEILPSQAMSLGDLPIAGIVTELGGGTSHAAILARSRGIPAVSGLEGIMTEVETGDMIVVDGRDGMVIVRPDKEATVGLSQGSARVFRLQGPALRQSRPAGPKCRRHAGRAARPTSTTWPMPRRPTRWGRPASACSGPSTSS